MAVDIREAEKGLALHDQSATPPPKRGFELETPRSAQEIAALRRKIVTIAQVFSTNAKIRVLPTLADDELWSCALGEDAATFLNEYMDGRRATLEDIPAEVFQPKTIYYTRGSLAHHTQEEILGVARHEIAHVNHTDFRYLFEGQKLVSSQGYPPLSWVNISNPLEDTFVNTQEMDRSETIRQQMEARYQARLPDLEEHTPTLPVNLQLGKNILYYWASGGRNCPTITDQRVLSTFAQIRPDIDRVVKSSSPSETYQIIKDRIWPVYKSLEEQAQQVAQQQELLNQFLGQGAQSETSQSTEQPAQTGEQQEGQSGQQTETPQGEQESPPHPQGSRGLLERLRQMLGGGRRQSVPAQTPQPSQPGRQEQQPTQATSTTTPGSAPSSLGEQLKQEIDPNLQQELAQAAREIRQLPERLQQELEQAFNNLPQHLREQIAEHAKQSLEQQSLHELEQEGGMRITKAERNQQTGRMELHLNTISEQEAAKIDEQMQELEASEQQTRIAEAAERERISAEERQRLAEELAKQKRLREMKEAGFDEKDEQDYARFRELEAGVKPRVPNFIKRLLPVLPKRWHPEYEGHFYTGKRTDVKVLGKKIPVGDYRVQLRKDLHPTEEPRIYVQLLIDNSGTMAGTKMNEAIKTGIFFARVLKVLEVPFAIKLFGESVTSVMNLGQDYDDIRLKIKPSLVKLTTADEGSTDIGSPLIAAHEEMLKSRRTYADSQGMIFLVTDGRANAGLVGEALKGKADEIKKLFPIFMFLLENKTNPAFLAEMEAIFGAGFVTQTANFTQLLPSSEKVLLTQMSRLLPRWQT